MIFGNSQGYINVQLTRWDANSQQRITVASANQVLAGMAMSWASFSIPLTYVEGNNPDSCMITLSASGSNPTNGDYLWVDNLSFSGTVTGIKDAGNMNTLSIYPNPVSDLLYVDGITFKNSKIEIQISDMQGKIVKSLNNFIGTEKISIDISELSNGNYLIQLVSGNKTYNNYFIKE
jgi:hypothetical protein